MSPTLADVLSSLERVVAELSTEEVPALLGELERLKAGLWARMTTASPNRTGQPDAPPNKDQLLTPEETAALLSVSVTWLYRHHKRLPFTRRLSRKALRFSEAGVQRWLATKRA